MIEQSFWTLCMQSCWLSTRIICNTIAIDGVAWSLLSVSLSVCVVHALQKRMIRSRCSLEGADSRRPGEPCIRWGPVSPNEGHFGDGTRLCIEYKYSIHYTKYMGFLHEDGGCLIQRSVLQRRCRLLLRILWQAVVTPSPIGETEYCDDRVCLSVCVFVCPRAYLRNATSSPFFVLVTYVRGSVFLWRRCDILMYKWLFVICCLSCAS